MPIPKPKTGESRQNFMQRCMGDKTMTSEYENDQRLAVCASSYNSKKEDSEEAKEEIRKDVFLRRQAKLMHISIPRDRARKVLTIRGVHITGWSNGSLRTYHTYPSC